MGRDDQRSRENHDVPSASPCPSTNRRHSPPDVASSPSLPTAVDSDVHSNIPSSQISPTNTIRLPRGPRGYEAARLERKRRPKLRVNWQAQFADKLAQKLAARKAKQAMKAEQREDKEVAKVKKRELIKELLAKLKDFGKNLLDSVRARVTGGKASPTKPAAGDVEEGEEPDPGDPGDWIPWFQYPDIPGVPLGPRLQLFEYPELRDFRKNWMESQSNGQTNMLAEGSGDVNPGHVKSRNVDTTVPGRSGYADRADADRDNTYANRTEYSNKAGQILPKQPDGKMVGLGKAKALFQNVSASTQPKPGPADNRGFSSVWEKVAARPIPSRATSANLPRPNRPDSILSTVTVDSDPDSAVTIANRDHMTFAIGSLVPGVTRVCLARDMPGLSEAVSNINIPEIAVTSESENETKIPPEARIVNINPDGPQVQELNGAGPFRYGLMPSPTEGPSNVVRLEKDGTTLYTTVDAVEEIQEQQRDIAGYTEEKPTEEKPTEEKPTEGRPTEEEKPTEKEKPTEEKTTKEPIDSNAVGSQIANSDSVIYTEAVKPIVEKKRNRIAEWFNRFKDKEPIRPNAENSVNLNEFTNRDPPANGSGEPLQSKPSIGPSTMAKGNSQPRKREPIRPPNSENYTFTPRLPPPSVTAFVYRQDDTDEREGIIANSSLTYTPNRLLTIDMKADTTAMSERAKKKLEEAREVAMQQAAVRLRLAQERIEAKRQAQINSLQTIGKPPGDAKDVAMEEAAICLHQVNACTEDKQAVKSNPVERTENPLRDATDIAMEQAVIRLCQAQERIEAKRNLVESIEVPFLDARDEEAAIPVCQIQDPLEAKQTEQAENITVETTEEQLRADGNEGLALQSNNAGYHTPAHTPQVSTPPPIFQPVDYNLAPTSYSPYEAYSSRHGDSVAPLATSSRVIPDAYMDQEYKGKGKGKAE